MGRLPMARIRLPFVVTIAVVMYGAVAHAAPNDWAEYGATRDYYNNAGLLRWKHKMGDWHDAEGKAQGDKAYATAAVNSDSKGKFVEWDVSSLVQAWLGDKHPNQGM